MSGACERGLDAGAYVLHALEDTEHEDFTGHLDGCATCRREVRQLQVVVDTLPMAAPQALPPDALKSRIMTTVRAEAELLQAAGPEADRVPSATPPRRRSWRPAFALRPMGVATAAAGLLGLGILGGVLVRGDDGPTGPPTRTIAGTVTMQGGEAQLVTSGDRARLVVRNLPAAAKGRVYQVWLKRGDAPPAPTQTLFDVRPDGRTSVLLEESIAGVDQVLVTSEPDGGSATPSGAPIIDTRTS